MKPLCTASFPVNHQIQCSTMKLAFLLQLMKVVHSVLSRLGCQMWTWHAYKTWNLWIIWLQLYYFQSIWYSFKSSEKNIQLTGEILCMKFHGHRKPTVCCYSLTIDYKFAEKPTVKNAKHSPFTVYHIMKKHMSENPTETNLVYQVSMSRDDWRMMLFRNQNYLIISQL